MRWGGIGGRGSRHVRSRFHTGIRARGPGAARRRGQTTGEVVCAGSTVTLSGEGGAPAASSNQFPVGTQLRVTNLDNNKSTWCRSLHPPEAAPC